MSQILVFRYTNSQLALPTKQPSSSCYRLQRKGTNKECVPNGKETVPVDPEYPIQGYSSQAISQLLRAFKQEIWGLNLGPSVCQARALPLSYHPSLFPTPIPLSISFKVSGPVCVPTSKWSSWWKTSEPSSLLGTIAEAPAVATGRAGALDVAFFLVSPSQALSTACRI